jgi:hypothetical protein
MEIADKLEDIEFVDDVCLLTEKRNHMQRKLQKLEAEARKTGLKINVKKTKISEKQKRTNKPNQDRECRHRKSKE